MHTICCFPYVCKNFGEIEKAVAYLVECYYSIVFLTKQTLVVQMNASFSDINNMGLVLLNKNLVASKLTIIGSVNGLSPGQRQAITWTIAEICLIGPLGTHFSEILTEIHTFSLKKCIWKYCLENLGHFVSASVCFKQRRTVFIFGCCLPNTVLVPHHFG